MSKTTAKAKAQEKKRLAMGEELKCIIREIEFSAALLSLFYFPFFFFREREQIIYDEKKWSANPNTTPRQVPAHSLLLPQDKYVFFSLKHYFP